MSVPTPALEPGKKPLESRRRYVGITQMVLYPCPLTLDIRYRDGQKLSISEQLNDPGSLWRTAHLPGPEPVKVATHPIAQSQSTGAQLSKAMDKGHSASEIGNPDGSRDVPSRYRRPQAEPSKTLSDFVASGGAKGKMQFIDTNYRLMHRRCWRPKAARSDNTTDVRETHEKSILDGPEAQEMQARHGPRNDFCSWGIPYYCGWPRGFPVLSDRRPVFLPLCWL
jgi:hypothetical protein